MEKFQESHIKAKKHLHTADHMLTITYPLIKDPKLLLAVTDNVRKAAEGIIETMLEYERLYRRVPPYVDNFAAKFELFRNKVSAKYNFDNDFIIMVKEIVEIVNAHKNSPMEFTRKEKFVICNKQYATKTISAEDLKKYIAKLKLYHKVSDNVLKNDRIFN